MVEVVGAKEKPFEKRPERKTRVVVSPEGENTDGEDLMVQSWGRKKATSNVCRLEFGLLLWNDWLLQSC